MSIFFGAQPVGRSLQKSFKILSVGSQFGSGISIIFLKIKRLKNI